MRKLLLTLAVVSIAALSPPAAATTTRPVRSLGAGSGRRRPVRRGHHQPEGDQKEAVDAILAKFPGGGQAGDKLKDLIEKGLRESDAPISFKEDIEPWLGDEAAFFVGRARPERRGQARPG